MNISRCLVFLFVWIGSGFADEDKVSQGDIFVNAGKLLTECPYAYKVMSNELVLKAFQNNSPLCYSDLTKVNFTTLKVSGIISWAKQDLRQVDLSGSYLYKLRMDGVDLSGANLKNARLLNVSLKKATIVGVNFEGAEFQDVNMERTRFESNVLTDVNFNNVKFKHATLKNTSFKDSKLFKTNFESADLSGVDFEHTQMFQSNFKKAEIYNVIFKYVELSESIFGAHIPSNNSADFVIRTEYKNFSSFSEAKLREVTVFGGTHYKLNFEKARLDNTSFFLTRMENANFEDASWIISKIDNATFDNSNFRNTEFVRTNFKVSSFKNADLTNAHFSGSSLENANLEGAILAGANLEDVNLIGAVLKGADLTNANISNAVLYGFLCLDFTLEKGCKKFGEKSFVDFRGAKNISQLVYDYSDSTSLPIGIFKARDVLRKEGFENEADDITFFIKRGELIEGSLLSSLLQIESLSERLRKLLGLGLSYLAFDWTVNWGADSGRAIVILLPKIIMGSGILYLCLLVWFFRKDPDNFVGILIVKPIKHNFIGGERQFEQGIYLEYSLFKKLNEPSRQNTHISTSSAPIPLSFVPYLAKHAIWFSVLSAFHFGWRDLNVGSWISRVQTEPFIYKPYGIFRVISGIQSLICVYLLVIWVLTTFSNPWG